MSVSLILLLLFLVAIIVGVIYKAYKSYVFWIALMLGIILLYKFGGLATLLQ